MRRLRTSFLFILLLALAMMGSAQTALGSAGGQRETPAPGKLPAVSGLFKVRAPTGQELPEPLRIFVGKSLIVNSRERLKRVSVTDPKVASAVITSPNQVLIHGLEPGRVSLILWDERDATINYDLRVEFDLSALREAIGQVLPRENIQASQTGPSIVLTGSVSSKEIADKAVALAQTQAKGVVNLLTTTEVSGEVLLQVRFAEVDRTAVQQLGLNIFSTGAANTPGVVSTQQFGPIQRSGQTTGTIPGRLGGAQTTFTLSDLLNIFVFRPDLNLGLTIRALQQHNLLQILAEPNLLALNGREANFLAGGEFPFPVLQGGGAFQAVTIQFREFGVRLKFTPNIFGDGTIRLKVAPEVSALDFSNALTISGFVVPALTTRRAETEVELRDGQSFAIAGLMDNRLTEVASKIPALGDIPIIGKLFRSRSLNRNNTELLVMVTPKLVRPLSAGQVPPLPTFPKTFIDKERFDGKSGEAPTSTKPKRP